ncbi:DUF4249 family protein [Pontibacter sp. BAB1700]|uniref:DUF4249 family protein n=1 Tax=Pontibacter sp. BAB1700 TaxID=1144253 RepID=UPI0008FAE456|nr:DUF4249 family protein [Pontibacter sp. BAB1700]
MKTRRAIYTLLLPLLFLLLSCDMEQEVEIKLPPYESQLVVECYLEPGKPLRAVVLESVSYFNEPELPLVPDAEVFITHQAERSNCLSAPFKTRRRASTILIAKMRSSTCNPVMCLRWRSKIRKVVT